MKKIVVGLIVLVAVLWLALTVGANTRKATAAKPEWPMGLGPLESVPSRYPARVRSPAAAELERLASSVGIEFSERGAPQPDDPVTDYVWSQLKKPGRTIDRAPALPPGTAAVRAHLLSGQPVIWDVDIARGASAPVPNLLAHTKLARLLTASALERARVGDAGAWDDLRAQRELARGLWQRPELTSTLIALGIDRHVIGAARKMPLPAPAWFTELRTFNHRKAMLAAMQADSWIISTTIREYAEADDAGANWVRRLVDRTIREPYTELSRADLIAHQRDAAARIAKQETCALEVPMPEITWWNRPAQILTPNIHGAWQRVFRVRAELELTEHALGLRSGSGSRCTDGQWVVTPSSVKFSKAIPSPGPGTFVIPLELTR